MYNLSCDYNCGTAPEIMDALNRINSERQTTYGLDAYSLRAKDRIRQAVENPDADVWLLVGGTQTNAAALDALLMPYQGVVCVETGHIAVHEAGAIEHGTHKVITLPGSNAGILEPDTLRRYLEGFYADETWPHMIQPGAVYISHPTENGCLYSLDQLKALRELCDQYQLKLYLDGARLAYALASPANEITLPHLGALCDAFYIGGTKCGALLGEALVFRKAQPFFFTQHKQHGALLAKGWLLGLQFDLLFTDGLYQRLGTQAIHAAQQLHDGLKAHGFEFVPETGTNQLFVRVTAAQLARLQELTPFDVWSRQKDSAVVRLCTSWATTGSEVNDFLQDFCG